MKANLTLLFFFSISFLFAQLDTIHFANPSFENNLSKSERRGIFMPTGWSDCGFNGETPPDVLPMKYNSYQITKKPIEGKSFIGMVVRDNRTWERMGQKLSKPLKAGKCYSFSVDLARSENYISGSRLSNIQLNYNKPIILRIFGGKQSCGKHELLAVSPLIERTDWLGYNFTINPKKEYQHILFEAYYQTPIEYPYNGNILIDNLSAIHEFSCESNDQNISVAGINENLEKHLKYFDKNESQPVNLTERMETEKRERQRFAFTKNDEAARLSNDRNKAALSLLKEKVEILVKKGLFIENEKEVNIEGTEILNQIIKLLKTNPNLGLDIALKKQGSRKTVTWRVNYLHETFLANWIRKANFDVDKISKYESSNWAFENKILAISAYLKN